MGYSPYPLVQEFETTETYVQPGLLFRHSCALEKSFLFLGGGPTSFQVKHPVGTLVSFWDGLCSGAKC